MEKPEIKQYFRFSRKENFDFDKETYDCSVLFINVSGSFQYRINGSAPAVVNPGEIVYCPPFCSFQRKVISPIELHMIKFEGSLLHENYTLNSRIRENLKSISHIPFSGEPESDPLLAHYLHDIVYALSVQSVSVTTDTTVRYMNENYHLPISNRELCEKANCSEVSLIARVRALTGKTPKQYINEKRIEAAKELLLSSNTAISEIAPRCGFEDALYFSKAFRKATGMSPSEFKTKYSI